MKTGGIVLKVTFDVSYNLQKDIYCMVAVVTIDKGYMFIARRKFLTSDQNYSRLK